jgi:tripartite-type tricarboxylate transporter receptor subunit TctC
VLRKLIPAAAAALALVSAGAAFAQSWPTKPVTFVVPFPPGGSVDPLARLIGAKLSDALGHQFVVDNKPGAAGSIGAGAVAKAAPDGYTWLFVFDTHAVNPALIPNLPFDTKKDLAPVTLVGTAPMAIATALDKPYKSFEDVIKASKAKPKSVSYGSVGSGSLGHLTLTLVGQAAGIDIVHVPYRGGGPMVQDAIGGHTELAIGSVAVISPHVRSGKLRAVAVTGDKRTHVLPDVATLAEGGFPGFSALAWWGIFAPAGTPQPIMDKFHAEVMKVLQLPDVRETLTQKLGMDIVASTPQELGSFLDKEMARWGDVVRKNGIKTD